MSVDTDATVTLRGLLSRVDLNGKQGVVCEYVDMTQRWGVEMAAGGKVYVKAANLATAEILKAQAMFALCGFPKTTTPALRDLVVERTGVHGRYFVAAHDIRAATFARDEKVSASMSAGECNELGTRFLKFSDATLQDMLGTPVSCYLRVPKLSNMTAMYVVKCLEEKWLQEPIVVELMDYDWWCPQYLERCLMHMQLEDLLWIAFWQVEYPDVPADTIWTLVTFLLTYAYMYERSMCVGLFYKANCPQKRWGWYEVIQRGEEPGPLESQGNMSDMPPFAVQTTVGIGQIPANWCVWFRRHVLAGEEVHMDYGEFYFPDNDSLLRWFQGTDMESVVFKMVECLDARVGEALEAHISSPRCITSYHPQRFCGQFAL
jgi:hypothetical protein